MSFRQYVCCNFKGITGERCEQRFELAGSGALPTGWIALGGTRKAIVDDLLRDASGHLFATMREQLQSMGPEGRAMIEQLTANALEAAPRVEIEAHLCPRHAETMPLVEWHLVPNVD